MPTRRPATSSDRIALPALLVLLGLAAAAAWWLELRPSRQVDPSRLAALPLELGDWRGRSIPLSTTVERMLDADFNLQRVYRAPGDEAFLWLYIGYYGTERGGRPEHTPAECYPAAGWQIERGREVTIDPASDWRAIEYRVSQRGERRLVLFWYASARRFGMVGDFERSLDRLRGRLLGAQADGALVRVSTSVGPEGLAGGRARLLDFARGIGPAIASRWPVELPSS